MHPVKQSQITVLALLPPPPSLLQKKKREKETPTKVGHTLVWDSDTQQLYAVGFYIL